jgi:nucleoside-diphosphate kinase
LEGKIERTLIIIKPDGVARGLVGEIIHRIERKGLSLVGLKMLQVERTLAEKHYTEHISRPFFPGLLKLILSGPVVVMAVEGYGAISIMRALVGPTSVLKAPGGTIRGDFATSGRTNIVHASDSGDSAQRELALWFKSEELLPAGKGSGIAARAWLTDIDELLKRN